MMSERWKQISHIYHEALGLKANQRAAFLNKACANDKELLRQINALMESHEKGSGFLESPAVAIAAKAIAADGLKRSPGEASARVLVTITKGPREGKTLAFSGHRMCVFGRANDCYEILPENDPTVGRHHFMLEVRAPDVSIRDLGSLNGTLVNGRRLGGRMDADAAARQHPGSQSMQLHHGDKIQIGDTVLEVAVEAPVGCAVCGQSTRLCAPLIRGASAQTALCDSCLALALDNVRREAAVASVAKVICDLCKKDVGAESGPFRQGNYICEACRARMAEDKTVLKKFLDTTSHSWKRGGAPPIRDLEFRKTLGRGRLGTSYLARDKGGKRQVVVKVVFSKAIPDTVTQPELLSQFSQIRSLRHPNIVEVIDFGSAGNTFYVVSDYCTAGNVGQLMARRKGRLGMNEAAPIMLQILEGLAFAHKNGLFHGDLKPENILLNGDEGKWVARISDLGLSRTLQQAGIGNMLSMESASDFPFTPSELLTGSGTPGPASDVWSIAAVFYFMLAGRLPHDSQPEMDPLGTQIESPIVPISERCPDMMPEFAQLIDGSLRSGASRYRNADEMLAAMRKAHNKVIRLTLTN